MPATAITHTAGSRQRERGELPQQPPGALCGILLRPRHSLGQHRLSTRAVPGTPWSGHFVLMAATPWFPQALAAAPLQLLCCARHSSALFQLESEHSQLGVQRLCWRGHR